MYMELGSEAQKFGNKKQEQIKVDIKLETVSSTNHGQKYIVAMLGSHGGKNGGVKV